MKEIFATTSIAGSSAAANTGRNGARFSPRTWALATVSATPTRAMASDGPPVTIRHRASLHVRRRHSLLQGFDREAVPAEGHGEADWFPNSLTTASGGNLLVHHLPAFFKDRPPLDESTSYLYGWLAGYFQQTMCGGRRQLILDSANWENLEFVRAVCVVWGSVPMGSPSR